MKNRLLMLILAACPLLTNAQDAQITLHTQQANNLIHNEIYGQFAEHLGRCIYGGIWVGKDSEIPNIEGYRKDVLEALQQLQIPVLRWPGGCFADEYHWMDGIGPQALRPRMVNTNWGGTVEDNSFGTHEFLNLCEMLGIQPYISANVGSGTVEEMAKWVEYINSDTNSSMAELRRKNGRETPWNVKYFGVGNESWGCGGNMTAEFYADQFKRYNTYARNYGNNRLFRIASGANANDLHWTEVAMKNCAQHMDGLSLHFYAVRDWNNHGPAIGFNQQDYYETISKAMEMDYLIQSHIAIMDKYDPEKKVGLMVDEWGTWWDVQPATNPGWLFQQNTIRDAIVAATTFDIFHKYTDRIKMANIAQMVNVLQAMVLTNENNPSEPCCLTPTYYLFKMYNAHRMGRFLPADINCEFIQVNEHEKIPQISSTASINNDIITLSVTNINAEKWQTIEVNFDDVEISNIIRAEILTSKQLSDYNDFGYTAIQNAPFSGAKINKKNHHLMLNIPPHAIVTIQLK